MKTLIILFFLLFSNTIFGQTFSYPKFNKSYKSTQEFVQSGWTLLDTIRGDLNGDNLKDLVAILEYMDTISEKRPNNHLVVSNPRVLLIFFKNNNGNFDLKLQHNTFILRNGEYTLYELFPSVSIKKRVLSIHYSLDHDYLTYKFRHQNNDFYLIGATVKGIHGGNWSEEDINFNTKNFYMTSYYIDDEMNKKVKHLYLKGLQPIRLKDFKMPLTLKISDDYTL